MEEHKKKDIEYDFADILIDMPHDFSVGRKHFRIYPVTLAKVFLLSRYIEDLDINSKIVNINPYLEAIRLANEKKEKCCYIMAIHTAPNTYKDLFNRKAITERKNFFMKECDVEDIASIMIYAITWDKTEEISRFVGIDKERERKAKVMSVRSKDKNNVNFGGVSILGAFIGQMMEMGFSYNEIMYERGYIFLRLMLADKITSIYLSDDELNKLSEEFGGTMIDANDPDAMDKLKGKLGSKGVKFE